MPNHITQQDYKLKRSQRQASFKHEGKVIWLTGLSGSGKSTLANRLEYELFTKGFRTYVLDGDNLRLGLNQDLNFTPLDRRENLRRVAEVSKLFVDAGLVVIAAFITPMEEDRGLVREIIGDEDYLQVFVHCPLEVCEKRDIKGLYKKARRGEIKDFTGIDAPYEIPSQNNLVVHTALEREDESLNKLVSLCLENIKNSF